MAHDVSVMGAVYREVPSVLLPDQQGTLNQFTDVSDTTAAAADVASGKYFYTSEGVRTAGTSEGGGGGGDDTDFANTIMRSGAITRIPDSVTTIGDYAFSNCTNLAFTELPSGVTSIGQSAFYDCTSLALTELPSGVTRIGGSAFQGCTSLALTELPSGVTTISSSVFYNCTTLALTDLPSGVTSIGGSAFQNCIGLQQLDAQNVGTIGSYAFSGCHSLTELVLRKSDTACKLSNVSAFASTPMRGYNGMSGTIYVPSALISTYQTATNWSTLYNAGHLTFAAIEGSKWEL